MSTDFDYSGYFGPILPLADATRAEADRCWGTGTEKDKISADYVLYLGCNVLRTVALAETITAILTAMNVDFVALGGPSNCCGVIHHINGDREVSEKLTAQSLAKFEAYTPRAVLTYCPSCHAHMDFALSEAGISFDVPYFHVTEFIVENLNQLTFPNRVERHVIFHGHSDDDQARRDSSFALAILNAIPGLDVIDATGAPEWGHDCGNFQIDLIGPEKHASLVEDLFVSAKAEGVDAVTVLYHSCYRNLCPQEMIHGIEVVHYTSLVAQAMGLPPRREAYKRLHQAADPDAAFRELSTTARKRGVNESRLKQTLDVHFRPK